MTEQTSHREIDEMEQMAIGAAALVVDGIIEQPPMSTSEQQVTSEVLPMPEEVRNKETWHQETEEAVREAYEKGDPNLFVLFIDVERFKSINDDLGHNVGDEVIVDIKNLQSTLVSSFRIKQTEEHPDRPLDIVGLAPLEEEPSTDPALDLVKPLLAGHGGGDEFLQLIHADAVGAKAVMTRLQEIFDDYMKMPEHAALRQLGIGLSMGLGQLPPLEGPITDEAVKEGKSIMLRTADEEMYQNKIDNMPWLDESVRRDLRTIDYLMTQVSEKLKSTNGKDFRIRNLQGLLKKMEDQDKLEAET